jgi:hypothetical protein
VTSPLRTPTLDAVPPIPPGLLGVGAADGAGAGRGVGALEKFDFDDDDEDRLLLLLLLLRPILPANDSDTVANNVLAMIAEARSLLSFI